MRTRFFDELEALGRGEKNKGAVPHVPVVAVSAAARENQVSVEISAPAPAPDTFVIWASDAETGEIAFGRRFGRDRIEDNPAPGTVGAAGADAAAAERVAGPGAAAAERAAGPAAATSSVTSSVQNDRNE